MKINQHKRFDYPIGLTVDIHDYCNASCNMCPYASINKTLNQGKMDWELYTKIANDFASLITLHKFQGVMTYCNMGEPFIENDLARYTQYAEMKGISVYLNTNASLMTPHKIDLLLRSGFKGSFAISFHAASPDVYKNIMGLDMDQSKRNIEYLLQHYSKEKIGFSVINYHWPVGEEEKVRALFRQWSTPVHISKPISRAGLVSLKRKKHVHRLAGCAPERVLYQMVVCHNGDVLLCCNDMSRKEVVGNLKNSTIREVWNGPVFERYLQEIYTGKKSSDSMICHYCEESVDYWSLRRILKTILPKWIISVLNKKKHINWHIGTAVQKSRSARVPKL